MNQIVTTGIVLRRINYGESDRIITFITPDKGKVSLIAKGTRKPKSKLAGSIELFGESQVTYIIGKGEISNLISARLIRNYGNIVKDLSRTNIGYLIIQIINKNLEFASGGEFYNLVKESFIGLNDVLLDQRILKIWFGLNFLDIMGHLPRLSVSTIDEDITSYDFFIDAMEFRENSEGSYSQNEIKFLRLVLNHPPIFLTKVSISDDSIDRLYNFMVMIMRSNGFEY
jgi:DNA repair protein RecO (recombination protein O)